MSPDPVDNEDARMWFNCVEEMVFNDDDFCSDTEPNSPVDDRSPSPDVLASRPKLQALQASYIVCLYQNWEGSDASKRRIRRRRFSTVVSVSTSAKIAGAVSSSLALTTILQVARDMGPPIARHPDYSKQTIDDFIWEEFVAREEIIRLVSPDRTFVSRDR